MKCEAAALEASLSERRLTWNFPVFVSFLCRGLDYTFDFLTKSVPRAIEENEAITSRIIKRCGSEFGAMEKKLSQTGTFHFKVLLLYRGRQSVHLSFQSR
jgi:hypothetical protein